MRAIEQPRNLQMRRGQPDPLRTDIVHVREDRRDRTHLPGRLGCPHGRVEMFDHDLIHPIVRDKDADRLSAETLEVARQIVTASSYTLALGKRAFYEQLPLDRPEAYVLAQAYMVENYAAADAQEGIQAFLEKRLPHWEN